MQEKEYARFSPRQLNATVLSGLAGGAILAAQMNLAQYPPPGAPFTEEFVRFLAGARWGSSDVIAGFLVIGILLALIYSWCERGLHGSPAIKGIKYGLILWMIQSLYIAWQPVLFLFRQPVAASLFLSLLWLPSNIAAGITISFLFTKLGGTTSIPTHLKESTRRVPISRLRLIGTISLTGFLAGSIAQGAWVLFARPNNWWINFIFDVGSQSPRFITTLRAADPAYIQFPNGDPTTLILLAVPMTIGYAMFHAGLAGGIWGKGLRFGLMIYVFRYVWREWMGDYGLIHQPLTLTPFFLATEIVRALVEGIAIAYLFEKISHALALEKVTKRGVETFREELPHG